jgi:hypothetical protein
MDNNHNWISLHIFYHQSFERILTECIGPMSEQLLEKGSIDRYFFIRYWQGGPHIRLRLQLTDESLRGETEAFARKNISKFLNRFPSRFKVDRDKLLDSQRQMALAELGTVEGVTIFDNNSIHTIPYEREWLRYGGKLAMIVSEEQFFYSSQLTLRLLPGINWHMRSILLGQAIQLMFVSAQAFRLDSRQAYGFFKYYAGYWNDFGDETNSFLDKEEKMDLFERKFQENKEEYLTQYTNLFAGIRGERERCEDDISIWWDQKMKLIYDKLADIVAEGTFETPDYVPDVPEAPYIHVLFSYLHMTNNRLGCVPFDESFLGFICYKTLQEKFGFED